MTGQGRGAVGVGKLGCTGWNLCHWLAADRLGWLAALGARMGVAGNLPGVQVR